MRNPVRELCVCVRVCFNVTLDCASKIGIHSEKMLLNNNRVLGCTFDCFLFLTIYSSVAAEANMEDFYPVEMQILAI